MILRGAVLTVAATRPLFAVLFLFVACLSGEAFEHKNSPYFAHPDFYNLKSGGSLTLIEKFETYQQTTEWSCGNASAFMVLRYFKNKDWRELDTVGIMGTNPLPEDGVLQKGVFYGTATEGMVRFFKHIGYDVRSSLESSSEDGSTFERFSDFREWTLGNLRNGLPILVEWVDWGGHWQVVIGYDTMGTDDAADDVLILADPYDTSDHLRDGYYIFPAERFFYMWYDYQFQPNGGRMQQWVIATPKGKTGYVAPKSFKKPKTVTLNKLRSYIPCKSA